MTRKLFLISDYKDNFDEFAARFVEASGGKKAKIVFLMQGGKDWKKYYLQYRDNFQKTSPIDFYPIFPDDDDEFIPEMVKKLKKATGIFVGGGYTFRYIRAYAESELTKIIVEKYNAGVPYGGLSAGAIITLRLGILDKIILKPHFSQQNRFFELQKKLRKSKAQFGLGLDDGIWLEVENEVNGLVFGKGNCYRCSKTENEEFETKIYHPGDKIDLTIE
ncbi:Type 1 glutamine amidotransferase-like domain-containing protein [Candidatus Cloacimonadota bacterium]